MKTVIVSLAVAAALSAQITAPNPTQNTQVQQPSEGTPIYKVTVVSRTAHAVNYRHRGGATKIDFRGTALMPKARGEAKVESKSGYIEVEVEFDDMNGPRQYGPEYLTYVLWAVSPEGRATNLGEILLNNSGAGKLNVTTELQSFGMIVTAEPYYAVTQPSDVVVMENVIRNDTKGKYEVIDAKYELLKRGSYVFHADQSTAIQPLGKGGDTRSNIYLAEARNAVQIAGWTGADNYASDTYKKASGLLTQAEDYWKRKQWKPASMTAREAIQTSEDARLITLRRQEEERLANERRAAAEREAAEKARAEEAQHQQQLAQERARLEAERRAQADQARTAAEQERLAAEKAKAEADAARAAAEKAQAEAIAQQQALAAQANAAKLAAEASERARLSAEAEKQQLRDQIKQQLNRVLETRESARGLIVNMSDVLFDFGKYTLRGEAREKLAKVSGIILAHPGLKIEVEGHTDSVGSDAFNQRLSEQRASTVRDYLVAQGIAQNMVTSQGFGETRPVATNDTNAGRQQNRRVELVVSGDIIGTESSSTPSAPAVPSPTTPTNP
jgi:outer membrane protein OmpA-like peptidoglycan-associated protein